MRFQNAGEVPTGNDILRWRRSAELMAPLLPAAGIEDIRPDRLKVAVRAPDVAPGKDVAQIRKPVAQLHGWCEDFAKGARRVARGMVPGPDDRKEVGKTPKTLRTDHDKAVRAAKPPVASARETAAGAARIAGADSRR